MERNSVSCDPYENSWQTHRQAIQVRKETIPHVIKRYKPPLSSEQDKRKKLLGS